ncbi:MAG: nuclear transport factor 2 family protein [Pseudomonadota bacterium]
MTIAARHIAYRPCEIAECVSAYLQEGDLDGVVSMFHPDCLVFFPPGVPPSVGLDGARQAFEAFINVRPKIESNVFSEIIAGDTAMLRANWRVIAPDGSVMAEGRSMEVARKLPNGGWGYLIDCPNGPPDTAESDKS